MEKYFILFILLLLSISGLSQYSLKGIVETYSSSKKIKHASIKIDTTYNTNFKNKKYIGSTVSNELGEFEIDNISVDKVNLIISYIAFETMIIENIKLDSNRIVDFGEIKMLRGVICAGYEFKDGDIKNRFKKTNKEIKLRYPKKGKKIKILIKSRYILINYQDITQN